jgi:hypothetical protein
VSIIRRDQAKEGRRSGPKALIKYRRRQAKRGQVADSGAIEAIRLHKYIPDCAHGAILVTTRNKIVGQKLTRGRCLIKVSSMNEAEFIELFASN